jgi:hypothetical protein
MRNTYAHILISLQKLLALTVMLIFSAHVNAIIITETLNVDVIDGPGFGEVGTISVTYESTDITGVNSEFLENPDVELELDRSIWSNIHQRR